MQNDAGAITSILLKRYHVPRSVIDRLRIAYANEGIQNGESMQYDRIMTGMALTLSRMYELDGEKIIEFLRAFDALAACPDTSWPDLMQELDDRTGIVVQADPERFICEYRGRDTERQKDIAEAEERMKEQ